MRLLYRGLLRVLLVLLHDFPEFLADYHFALVDAIPPTCVQMRNIVLSGEAARQGSRARARVRRCVQIRATLSSPGSAWLCAPPLLRAHRRALLASAPPRHLRPPPARTAGAAFPRTMRLPDPFTPNLKVDLLPESSQPPRLLSAVTAALDAAPALRADLEAYLKHRAPFSFLMELRLRLGAAPGGADGRARYNVPLISSLVLHVGMQARAAPRQPQPHARQSCMRAPRPRQPLASRRSRCRAERSPLASAPPPASARLSLALAPAGGLAAARQRRPARAAALKQRAHGRLPDARRRARARGALPPARRDGQPAALSQQPGGSVHGYES